MALELEGKVFKVLAEESGVGQASGKQWRKQAFVIETEDQYPKKVVFNTWNDTVDALKQLSLGVKVKVSFRPESREYQERWYTDLTAWKIVKISEQQIGPGGNTVEPPADVLYDDNNKTTENTTTPDLKKDEAEDDLPF